MMSSFGKIVVGYDDSDLAEDAVMLGKQIAGATGAELGGREVRLRASRHRLKSKPQL